MKYRIIALMLFSGLAHAAGPLIGIEFETEKDNGSGMMNHAVSIGPGWEFSEDSPISRIELLIERNQDAGPDGDGLTARENSLFLRLRRDGDLTDTLEYYVRGGVGRSFNNERDFNFAYVEPGIEYKFTQQWSWTVAFREIDSIGNMEGQHVGKFITGPNFDLDKNNEFELRNVQGKGDKNLTSWLFEYVHRM